jgi:hypothetical protein
MNSNFLGCVAVQTSCSRQFFYIYSINIYFPSCNYAFNFIQYGTFLNTFLKVQVPPLEFQ